MAKKAKKGRCKNTQEMLPPPSAREVGITAERVARKQQQKREWRALCRQRAAIRRRIERELAALQIKLGL